jgi:competence ComEA-like helix-hairpin-helix protein
MYFFYTTYIIKYNNMKRPLFILFVLFGLLFSPSIFAVEKIDINTASLSQLDELTGIGPTYAQAIIDARPFSSVDDLDRVKGIGPTTLQKIKDQGLACVNCATSTETVSDQANTQDKNPEKQTYTSGVYINEILPNPAGSDTTDEWVELYNSNNTAVDLSSWQIQDISGTITTYTILKDTISANGFLFLKRPETKIMLNNDTDGISLLTPDKKIIDSVNYTKAPLGQSYNKTTSSWGWSTTLTPGTTNIITGTTTKTKSPSTSSGSGDLSKPKNSVNNNGVEAGLADISQNNNPWLLFFTALIMAIILAVIALIIKLKIFKNHVRT